MYKSDITKFLDLIKHKKSQTKLSKQVKHTFLEDNFFAQEKDTFKKIKTHLMQKPYVYYQMF